MSYGNGSGGFVYRPWYKGLLNPAPQKVGFVHDKTLVTEENYEEILANVKSERFHSLDSETTGLRFTDSGFELITVNFSLPGNRNYIAFWDLDFQDKIPQKLPSREKVFTLIKSVLNDCEACFFWNLYYDRNVLLWTINPERNEEGKPVFSHLHPRLDFEKAWDGMHYFWLLDTNRTYGYGLKQTAETYLGVQSVESPDFEDIKNADPADLINYGGLDGWMTLELGILLYNIYVKEYAFVGTLEKKFQTAVFDFMDSEQWLDYKHIVKLSEEANSKIEAIKNEFYSKYGMMDLGSYDQRSALLLKLGYNTGVWNKPKKDGTPIMSTTVELLEKLWKEQNCDAARLLIEYTGYAHKNNNYISPFRMHIEEGGRNHFYYGMRNAPTCRLAGRSYDIKGKNYEWFIPLNVQSLIQPEEVLCRARFNPDNFDIEVVNLDADITKFEHVVASGDQNLNIRNTVSCPPGYVIVEADYAAQELRMPAALSDEPGFLIPFSQGKDPHTHIAGNIYHKNLSDEAPLYQMTEREKAVIKKERQHAKVANFSLMYLGTYYTLMQKLNMQRDEAITFEKEYRESLPTLYEWKQKVITEARATGSVKTFFGWERRLFPYYRAHSNYLHEFADRSAVNIIQCYGAWFLRIALVKIHSALAEGGRFWEDSYLNPKRNKGKEDPGIYFIATTHDSITFACPMEIAPIFAKFLKLTMQSVTPKPWLEKGLVMRSDVEIGKSWGSLVSLDPIYPEGLHPGFEQESSKDILGWKLKTEKLPEPKIEEEVAKPVEEMKTVGGFSF